MEGNILWEMGENASYIVHYRRGSIPVRHEFDNNRELYCPAIMPSIVDTGPVFFAPEFVSPATRKLSSSKSV